MPADPSRPPLRTRRRPGALSLPAGLLVDVLHALAAASSRSEVAQAVTDALAAVDGVRAAAVLQRAGTAAVIVGSTGYDCDAMAPGAALPIDSGLTSTQAIRSGERVVQGEGPAWCALPFGSWKASRGAVLLSLTCPPPDDPRDLDLLERLAAATGSALARAEGSDKTAGDLATVVDGLAPRRSIDGALSVAVRQAARGGSLGGDVVMTCPDARGGEWLLAADVCGSGLPAATGAAAVRVAMRAVAALADGPADLLTMLDAALRPEAPAGGFVTAVAVRVSAGQLTAASAGHPAPLLVTPSGAVELGVEPGPPLALETTEALPSLPELSMRVEPGSLLVLYTDGLTDRHSPDGLEIDVRRLAAGTAGRSPADAAQTLVDAAEAIGPAEDDASVLVAQLSI